MARLLKLRGLNCVWSTQVLYRRRTHCIISSELFYKLIWNNRSCLTVFFSLHLVCSNSTGGSKAKKHIEKQQQKDNDWVNEEMKCGRGDYQVGAVRWLQARWEFAGCGMRRESSVRLLGSYKCCHPNASKAIPTSMVNIVDSLYVWYSVYLYFLALSLSIFSMLML